MGEWSSKALGEVCAFKAGDAFKKELQGRAVGEVPFIKVSDLNLSGNEISITVSNNWISKEEAEKKYTIHPVGSTVFAKIGVALTYNRRRKITRPTVIDNNMMSAVAKDVSPEWLYYLLCTVDFNTVSSGSALPFLTVRDLSQIPIHAPPLPEQRAIAAVLCALDDKIALNRRMNETLEGLARALFKDWFVDFGPTRAKASGAKPDLPPETLSLFPDRLDDNGLPEGWEMGALADIAQSPRRGVKPADVGEDTPYIGLEHMPRRSIALTDWDGAAKVSSNKSRFRKGEFLFGKLRPYFHKVGVAAVDGICSTDIVVVTPKAEEWAALTLACISSDDFVEYTNAGSTGTKMPRTSWKIMGAYEMCIPHRELAQAYQTLVGPMIEKIIENIHQSRTLAQTRDLLLPKLMSGALRVGAAEEIVEGAL